MIFTVGINGLRHVTRKGCPVEFNDDELLTEFNRNSTVSRMTSEAKLKLFDGSPSTALI